MEEGEAAEPRRHAPDAVAAAERLRSAGWWGVGEEDRAALGPLIGSGLGVGVNLDYHMLGLSPVLVAGRTKGRESLWDAAGEGSYGVRSYHVPSMGAVMAAAPPTGSGYDSFWHQKAVEGGVSSLSVVPLEGMRFLGSPLGCFNEERGAFDFSWADLPRRNLEEEVTPGAPSVPSARVVRALNDIVRRPTVGRLEDAGSDGVEARDLAEAMKYVRGFPLGWGWRGPRRGESGLLLYYRKLSEEAFGAIRGAVASVPYTCREAWGRSSDLFVYVAEMVIPGEALAETAEYVGRVSSRCREGFSSGFYERNQLQSFPLSLKIAERGAKEPR